MENYSETGVNVFDLIGEPVTKKDLIKAEEFLKMNYGVDYPAEKFVMLWQMIAEEGWTTKRLQSTLKWFLKHKKYPNWTIADWFDYEVKVYPYSWYLKQVKEFGKEVNKQIEKYKINGKVFFCYSDTERLPFEYLGLIDK